MKKGTALFVGMAGLAALTAAAAWMMARILAPAPAPGPLLERAKAVAAALAADSDQRLVSGLRVFSSEARFKASLDPAGKADPNLVADQALNVRDVLLADWVQVGDGQGRLLAEVAGGKIHRPAAGARVDAVFSRAVNPGAPRAFRGVLAWGGALYQTVTGPILIQEKVLGGLRAGYALDQAFALRIKSLTGLESAFCMGSSLTACTLDSAGRADLQACLSAGGVPAGAVRLGGAAYAILATPLDGPLGYPVASRLLLCPLSPGESPWPFVAAGLAGILLAFPLAAWAARRYNPPTPI